MRNVGYNAIIERLAEHCKDVPAARRAFVPAAHARVRPRPLPRRRDAYGWFRWPRPRASPAGWWSGGAPASISPRPADPEGGRWGHNACITFSFMKASRHAEGDP